MATTSMTLTRNEGWTLINTAPIAVQVRYGEAEFFMGTIKPPEAQIGRLLKGEEQIDYGATGNLYGRAVSQHSLIVFDT